MAVYRATRTSAFDATQYRIDIVPYDAKIGDAVTTLDEGCIVDIGDLEYGFDDVLPYGLAGPATWSVRLNYSRLPSALQTYLRNRETAFTPSVTLGNVSITGNARNTFLLWTDYGTGTFSLVFCGVVESTESITYESNKAGELECDIQLLDAAYHTLLEIEGSKLEGYADYDDYDLRNSTEYSYEVLTSNGTKPILRWINEVGRDRCTINMMKWATVCDSLQEIITKHLIEIATRSNRGTLSLFDHASNMYGFINTGVRMYTPTTTYPRAENAEVDETTAYLATSVHGFYERTRKGGLMDSRDEYGFAQAQSLKDVLNDLCETFGVKMYWQPSYQLDGSEPYIRYDVSIACVLANGASNGAATTYDMDTAIDVGNVTEGAGLIGKAECRASLEGDDKNVGEWVEASARSRSERSINVEPILHNLPTWKDKLEAGGLLRQQSGFSQTNAIYTPLSISGSTQWVKLHEYTEVAVRATAGGGAPVDSYTVSSSGQLTDASDEGLRLWLTEVQGNAGSPKGVAKAMFNAFSYESQSECEVTWRLDSSTNISQVGSVHDLTNGVSVDLPHLQWSKACVTRVIMSPSEGTSTFTYFLPGF